MSEFIVTKEWVEEWYNIYNESVFDFRLPSTVVFGVSTENKKKHIDGVARYERDDEKRKLVDFSVEITTPLKSENFAKSTLLHEMIHIEDFYLHPEHFYNVDDGTWIGNKYDSHGEWFKNELERINGMGMEGIHVITGVLAKKQNTKKGEISDYGGNAINISIRKLPDDKTIKPRIGLRPTFSDILKMSKKNKTNNEEETDD